MERYIEREKEQGGDLAKRFASASETHHPDLIELVKHLARISAAKDHEKFLSKSKMSYSKASAKGKKP